MTVGASENHRIVRRDFVEVPACGKRGGLPVRLDPSSSSYPLAGFCLIDAFFHFREEVREACRAFQVQSHLALADARKMLVRISKTGHDGVALEIDDARLFTDELLCGSV